MIEKKVFKDMQIGDVFCGRGIGGKLVNGWVKTDNGKCIHIASGRSSSVHTEQTFDVVYNIKDMHKAILSKLNALDK